MEFNPHRPPVEIFADPITKVYSDIVDQLLVNIARKFNVTDKTTGSTDWQFQQLAKMGQLTQENITIIAKMTGQNVELMQEALERSAMAALDEIEPQFAEAVKKGFLHDAPMSDGVKSVLSAYQSQAIDKLNLVNTTMLQSSQAAFKKAVSSTGIYTQQFMSEEQAKIAQQALNTATGSVATGAESRTAAVRKALKEMSDAGITGFVDKSGKQWSAEAYVNMDVRTTCGNVATEAAFARNRDYGNDLIWWPILATARPGCYPYQGKVCSTTGRSGTVEDLDGNQIPFIALSSTTYGEPAGIGGINCHHKPPNVFIPGMSKVRGEVPPKNENDKRYEKGQAKKRAEREARYAKRDAEIAEASKDTDLAKKATKKSDAMQASLNKQAQKQTAKSVKEFESEKIDPRTIEPVNPVTSAEKKDALAYDFYTDGYSGRPIVAIEQGNNGYQALTGSHRIYAAREAGIDIPTHVSTVSDRGAMDLANAHDDQERLAVAEKLYKTKQVDKQTLDLLRIEESESGRANILDRSTEKANKWRTMSAEKAAKEAADAMAYRAEKEASDKAAREAAAAANTPMIAWEKRMSEKHGSTNFWLNLDSDDWADYYKIGG